MTGLDLPQLQRLLFLFVGIVGLTLIALVAYVVISGRRKATREAPLYEAKDLTVGPVVPVHGQVLALVREEMGGRLVVDVDGVRYRTLTEVEDPEVKRKIVRSAMELIQFTGVLGEGALEPAPLEQTKTWREDLRRRSETELERARSSSTAAVTSEEIEERFLNLLADLGQAPGQPERPGIVDSIQHRLQPKPLDPDRPRTFVDDIDDIVQRRIQMIPALQGRQLHVRPGVGGKVLFVFEGKAYQSVDEVPNLTARQLVKDAIQEWDETT